MTALTRVGLYCHSDVIGGAERSLLTLLGAAGTDHDLVVVSPSDALLAAVEATVPGTPIHRVEAGDGLVDDIRRHRSAFAALDLDLLQITLPNPFAARSAHLAAYSLRLPTVAVQQLVLPAKRRRGALLVRALARPLAATIAVGRRSADDLHRFFGLDPRHIEVVHNGIAMPAPPPPPGGLDRPPVVGCVARYEDQKGIDRLIRAVAEIPDARLLLVGDGSRRDDLERLAEELDVQDRVEVGPWRDDARSLIAAFDVFALASVDEAFPLTIVEAMLAGTPVVATDVGSVREAVIDGETGRLVRSGDHAGLVAALRSLLDDRAEAERLAARARELAEADYTAEAMAAGYRRVWDAVLAGRR